MRTTLLLAALLAIAGPAEARSIRTESPGIPLWRKPVRTAHERSLDHNARVAAFNEAFRRRDYRAALKIANRAVGEFPDSPTAKLMQSKAQQATKLVQPIPCPTPARRGLSFVLDVF